MSDSLAEIVARLSDAEREAILEDLDPETLQWDSKFWLRPEQIEPTEDYRIWLILAGRGFGKLLSLDTPILLASGEWTHMGDIKDGDVILDEEGQPTTVLKAHDLEVPKKAYRLHFSDGTYVDAGEEHLWTTWTHKDRKSFSRTGEARQKVENDTTKGYPKDWPQWTRHNRWGRSTGVGPKTRSTQEIVDSFRHGKRGDLNHSIPLAKPIQFEEKDYKLDPQLLGIWLGDGTTKGHTITCHKDEVSYIEELFISNGFEVSSRHSKNNTWTVRVYGLVGILKELGVFGNKHIPREYLSGSVQQRKLLLSALLDTDGTINKTTGHVEFCSVLPELAEGVLELVRGLGEKPTIKWSESKLYGVRKKDRCRITWRPKFNPFGMPRKRTRFNDLGSQAMRNFHRMIISFEEIEPTEMRCITVDSPNSLYLAGKGLIPTHNTRAGSEWIRDKARITKYGKLRMGIVARSAADVRSTVVEGLSGVMAVHPPSEMPEYFPSKRMLVWPNGNECLLFSSEEPNQLRGPSLHYLWGDEFASWSTAPDDSGLTAFDNAQFATREGTNPQLCLTTTPKKVSSVRQLLAEAEEEKEDPKERVLITRGRTMDNMGNLDKSYIDGVYRKYKGTNLAKQELEGEMLEEIDGVLWTEDSINLPRVYQLPNAGRPPIVVVGVDPTVAESPTDECGIVVCASTSERNLHERHAWVLKDASVQGSPDVWAQRVVEVARHYGAPIVVERNQGDALVKGAIRQIDPNIPVYPVWARHGKYLRAEAVSLAYQQQRVHHVGTFVDLESQMLSWTPEDRKSPDRIDALVHALTALMINPPPGFGGGRLTAKSSASRRLPKDKPKRSSGKRGAVFGAGIKKRF